MFPPITIEEGEILMAIIRRLFSRVQGIGGYLASTDSDLVAANATTDNDFTEGIGRKADAAVLAESTTASIIAYLKGILNISGEVVSVQTPDGSVTPWTLNASHRLFTVTGEVIVHAIFGKVDEALTGISTAQVGVAGSTAALIAQLANAGATLNAVNDIWVGRTASSGARYIGILDAGGVILSDIDIDLTIGLANVTNGQITFYVVWSSMSSDGDVSAAVWD